MSTLCVTLNIVCKTQYWYINVCDGKEIVTKNPSTFSCEWAFSELFWKQKNWHTEICRRRNEENHKFAMMAHLYFSCVSGPHCNCIEIPTVNITLGDFLCISTPNKGQLNPLFHIFAEFRPIVHRVVARQSPFWSAGNAKFSPNRGLSFHNTIMSFNDS